MLRHSKPMGSFSSNCLFGKLTHPSFRAMDDAESSAYRAEHKRLRSDLTMTQSPRLGHYFLFSLAQCRPTRPHDKLQKLASNVVSDQATELE